VDPKIKERVFDSSNMSNFKELSSCRKYWALEGIFLIILYNLKMHNEKKGMSAQMNIREQTESIERATLSPFAKLSQYPVRDREQNPAPYALVSRDRDGYFTEGPFAA
jgi:hypothetical protein